MFKKLFLVGVVLALSTLGYVFAASILQPGDIVFTVLNSDGAGTTSCPDPTSTSNGFEFVNRVNIEPGSVLYFTDDAWIGTGFRGGEGTITFTATEFMPAGTKTYYSDCAGSSNPENWSRSGSWDPAGGGDTLLVYQGTLNSGDDARFVYGGGRSRSEPWVSSGTTITTNNSYVPDSLSLGTTAIALGTNKNYHYVGTNCDFSSETFLADVANVANWSGNSAGSGYGPSKCMYYESILPVVTLSGPATMEISQGGVYTELGASWTDNIDGSGDVFTGTRGTTGSFAKSGVVNTATPGTYYIQYLKVDQAGNKSTIVTRTINVTSVATDTTPPVVTLSGSATVEISQGGVYTESGASWTDNVDGSGSVFTGTRGTTGSFAKSGVVNTATPGTYYIQYLKVDQAGNKSTTVTRTINVTPVATDTTPPVVTLSGSATMAISQGGTYTEHGAKWTDNVDGNGVIAVATSGTVNTNVTGVYNLEYRHTDVAGNKSNVVTRKVTVNTRIPLVILSGEATVTITSGDAYVEKGATWQDEIDGTGAVVHISGTVNTQLVGTYKIDYFYKNTAGNTGSVSRIVKVVAEVIDDNPLSPEVKPPLISKGGFAGGGGGILVPSSPSQSTSGSTTIPTKLRDIIPLLPRIEGDDTTTPTTPVSPKPSSEVTDAYQRAYKLGITTQSTIELAGMDRVLSRGELAKMLSVYAVSVMGKTPQIGKEGCGLYQDRGDMNNEVQKYTKMACELNIMGLRGDGKTPLDSFRAKDSVTRAELVTTISRMLYGDLHNNNERTSRWSDHMSQLQADNLLTVTDHTMIELRKNVFLMLYRIEK